MPLFLGIFYNKISTFPVFGYITLSVSYVVILREKTTIYSGLKIIQYV